MTTDNELKRREIDAHERCATSARSPEKRAEHELAASLLRKQLGIPEPVTFGRSEHHNRAADFRRTQSQAETEFKNR